MILYMHHSAAAEKAPPYLRRMFTGLFLLMQCAFLLAAFAVIYYAGQIAIGILLAILPIAALLLQRIEERNLENAFVEVAKDHVTVVQYPFGRRSARQIKCAQISYAKLILPYSQRLRGARLGHSVIPYIVFFDNRNRQLFKILAYPESLQFQQSITQLTEE